MGNSIVTFPCIHSESYTYDPVGNLQTKTDRKGQTITYTYDNLDRLAGKSYPDSSSVAYIYDNIYQLTQALVNGNTTDNDTYDAVGNRLTDMFGGTYSYNRSNELGSYSPFGYSWTYDANGNTTSETVAGGTTSYTWDYENRLTSVTLPNGGGTVSFKYDPFGRRIEKISPTAGTTIYAYDGDNIVEELDGSGSPTARYTQGLGIDEPLEVQIGRGSYYYSADGLGSIVALTKSNGSVANTYAYDTFGGDSPANSETVSNPFHYTARERDSETGLYYYRARYYDPLFGRFLSEDPIGFTGGNNFYDYASNSPVDNVDPLGLWSKAAHHQILWNALHGCRGVTDADIWLMQEGSDYADSMQFQGAQFAYMHAMSNGVIGQSPASAKQQTAAFIQAEMHIATSQLNAGVESQRVATSRPL